MKTLRLIYTYDCNRNCEGCCNKQPLFVSRNVPEINKENFYKLIKQFTEEDQIIITGGEPLLYSKEVTNFVDICKFYTKAKFILYTAKTKFDTKEDWFWITSLLSMLDGLTVTLHNEQDLDNFVKFDNYLADIYGGSDRLSLRLNIFKEIDKIWEEEVGYTYNAWKIKNNIEWLIDCPLPSNEILFKLE